MYFTSLKSVKSVLYKNCTLLFIKYCGLGLEPKSQNWSVLVSLLVSKKLSGFGPDPNYITACQ